MKFITVDKIHEQDRQEELPDYSEDFPCIISAPKFPALRVITGVLLFSGNRDITVSTFREGDEKGVAPRRLYKKYGFREDELTVEFDYPNQVFVLKGNRC